MFKFLDPVHLHTFVSEVFPYMANNLLQIICAVIITRDRGGLHAHRQKSDGPLSCWVAWCEVESQGRSQDLERVGSV